MRKYTEKCLNEGRYGDTLMHLLGAADTGIAGIKVLKDNELSAEQLEIMFATSALSPDEQERIKQQAAQNMRVQALHRVFNNEGQTVSQIAFPMPLLESQGTQKLFAFTGRIADTLAKGSVLFIDEMDAKFHSLITKALVNLFRSPKSNPKNAQLIFITHDTNLLDLCNLRRDQFWFVEKDRFGASHLYSLADFKGVRKGDFEEDYIAGRFGGIPILGDIQRAFADDLIDIEPDNMDEAALNG